MSWERFQKSRLGERAFELDYHSLRGHALWVGEDQRKIFHPRQISRTSVDEAIVEMERALKLNPDDAEGHKNLGEALRLQGRLRKAVAHLQQAVRLKPTDAEAYHNLGRALTRQRRWNEAILCYRQALRLKPDFAEAHKHLGDVYSRRPDVALDELIASFREAIRLAPDDAEAHNKLGCTLMDMGLQDEAISALRRACQLRPNAAWLHSHLLALLHLHPDYDARGLAWEHDRWNELHAAPLAPVIEPHANDPDPNRRLRIGYVSPNFREHPVGRFVLPLFAAHDRRNFEYLLLRVPRQGRRFDDAASGPLRPLARHVRHE